MAQGELDFESGDRVSVLKLLIGNDCIQKIIPVDTGIIFSDIVNIFQALTSNPPFSECIWWQLIVY